MDKPQQPQGNFVINLNFKRNTNPDAPPITGRISTPEDPETEFAFSAFAHTDQGGETYWIGPVDVNRSMRQALHAQPTRGENFIAIRENGFKVFREDRQGRPNPAYDQLSPEQQAREDSKPAPWGTLTRTAEEPQLRASAWERDPSRYGPWASGSTQHPLTKEQAAALRAGQPHAVALDQPEPATPPRRTRATAGRDRAGPTATTKGRMTCGLLRRKPHPSLPPRRPRPLSPRTPQRSRHGRRLRPSRSPHQTPKPPSTRCQPCLPSTRAARASSTHPATAEPSISGMPMPCVGAPSDVFRVGRVPDPCVSISGAA